LNILNYIGPISSSESLEVADYAAKYAKNAIFLSPTATSPRLSNRENFYRMVMSDLAQGLVLATLYKGASLKYFVTLSKSKDAYGDGLISSILTPALEFGIKNLTGVYISSNTKLCKGGSVAKKEASSYVTKLATVAKKYSNKLAIQVILQPCEVRAIFEEASTEKSLTSPRWFGSDSTALIEKIFSSTASKSFLKSVHYTATVYAGDNFVNVQRNQFMLELSTITKLPVISPTAALGWDITQLVYFTSALLATSSLKEVKTVLIHNSQYFYGKSGQMILNSDGDRLQGDYLIVSTSKENKNSSLLIETLWTLSGRISVVKDSHSSKTVSQLTVSESGSSFVTFNRNDLMDLVAKGCNKPNFFVQGMDPLTYHWQNKSFSEKELKTWSSSYTLYVPAVNGVNLNITCEDKTVYEISYSAVDGPDDQNSQTTKVYENKRLATRVFTPSSVKSNLGYVSTGFKSGAIPSLIPKPKSS